MTQTDTESKPDQREHFFEVLRTSVEQSTLVRLVLSKPTGVEPDVLRVTARQISLRGEACLSFVFSYSTRDITRNLPLPDGISLLRELIGTAFRTVQLHTQTEKLQLTISRKGRCTMTRTQAPTAEVPVATHDRQKQRWLELTRPFLVELGVTTAQHQLIPSMSRKWKQINKFIEVFAHAFGSSALTGAEQLRVVDFGSGKGYLTFAIHDWLRNQQGIAAEVTGVELRPELVQFCTNAIARLGIQGLRIEQGDVRIYQPDALNVMIALHACDTATDHAIHLGVRARAEIIMCSPCCHKQIRLQMRAPQLLKPILHHGVHLGQEAEMVTDGLRALLLDACGYDTQVFEFVSLEHTGKNKMILAVKRAVSKSSDEVLSQIDEIKRFYGIREHCLEALLKSDGLIAAGR